MGDDEPGFDSGYLVGIGMFDYKCEAVSLDTLPLKEIPKPRLCWWFRRSATSKCRILLSKRPLGHDLQTKEQQREAAEKTNQTAFLGGSTPYLQSMARLFAQGPSGIGGLTRAST